MIKVITGARMTKDVSTGEDTSLEMREIIIGMERNRRTRNTAIAAEVDIIAEILMRIVRSTVEGDIIITETMKGSMTTGLKESTNMRGVREIKMTNKAHHVLHLILLCSLCLTTVSANRVIELDRT